jgi:exosortase
VDLRSDEREAPAIARNGGHEGLSTAIAQSLSWIRQNRIAALLVVTCVATFVYFFGIIPLFTNRTLSTWKWAWQAWNPETNYEHAKFIPLIIVFLIWHDRAKLKNAPVGSSTWGWLFIIIGLLLFIGGARTLQARLNLTAIPFLLFGIVLYVWGKNVARVLLFSIAFLLFMVPLNFLTQATVPLQFFETRAATTICNLLGVHVNSVGAIMTAADNSFRFQVDEGCSGIRSLMAIAMISAVYGHLTQDRLWKKISIFCAAFVFAIIGNAGRLVSVVLVARYFGQDLAGGPYHAVSGYLSFPFAIAAMVLFGKLLNLVLTRMQRTAAVKEIVTYDY